MRVTSTVTINKPVSRVWDFFMDQSQTSKWVTGFLRYEQINGGVEQVGGVRYQYHIENGKEVKLKETITTREDYIEFATILEGSGMEVAVDTKFIDKGAYSEVQQISDFLFKSLLYKLVGSLMRSSLHDIQQADLNRFKEVIENS